MGFSVCHFYKYLFLIEDKSVNHCYEEDPDMCYKIEPLTMATKETQLDTSSELIALGEVLQIIIRTNIYFLLIVRLGSF